MLRKRKRNVNSDRDRALTIMAILPASILFLFSYLPLPGLIIAFKNFKASKGIFGSDWTNPIFRNFDFFFKSNDVWTILRNTLGLNLIFILENSCFTTWC